MGTLCLLMSSAACGGAYIAPHFVLPCLIAGKQQRNATTLEVFKAPRRRSLCFLGRLCLRVPGAALESWSLSDNLDVIPNYVELAVVVLQGRTMPTAPAHAASYRGQPLQFEATLPGSGRVHKPDGCRRCSLQPSILTAQLLCQTCSRRLPGPLRQC